MDQNFEILREKKNEKWDNIEWFSNTVTLCGKRDSARNSVSIFLTQDAPLIAELLLKHKMHTKNKMETIFSVQMHYITKKA